MKKFEMSQNATFHAISVSVLMAIFQVDIG